jgi:hypothetical protein
MGLVAAWCEFAQTIFFYPALLAYVADTLAYPFDPGLAANGVYTAVVIVILFWGGVLLCSLGPALLPEGQPPGHRGAHHRHGGRHDHPHRRAVRVHPKRLARLLDLHRARHAGVPDHVRADVHRRAQAAPFGAATPGRLPSPGPGLLCLLCLLGTVSSVAALVIGFVPPAQFSHLNPVKYT